MFNKDLTGFLKEISLRSIMNLADAGADIASTLDKAVNTRTFNNLVQFEALLLVNENMEAILGDEEGEKGLISIKFRISPRLLAEAYDNDLLFNTLEWMLIFPKIELGVEEITIDWLVQADIEITSPTGDLSYYDQLLEFISSTQE